MSYKAFVSSTFVDLKEHRTRVIEALRNAGLHVDPMEVWTAGNDEPKYLSVDRMGDCDLCKAVPAHKRNNCHTTSARCRSSATLAPTG